MVHSQIQLFGTRWNYSSGMACLGLVLSMVLADPARAHPEEDQEKNKPREARAHQEVAFIQHYCVDCHSGKKPKGKLDLAAFTTVQDMVKDPLAWDRVLNRIREGDMPPDDATLPTMEERTQFVQWLTKSLQDAACSQGPQPGPAMVRRLNKAEYSAAVRDLLGIHWDAGESLPSDGSGGEGFDNAVETLFLSPLHAEKYMESARVAVEYAFADSGAQERFLVARPGPSVSPGQAARRVLEQFLPRAFRRAATEDELKDYLSLFQEVYDTESSYMASLGLTLRAILVSPKFLFLAEQPNMGKEPQPVSEYELATRLSFFLWGSIPDETLLQTAREGKLSDPKILQEQVERMMSRRNRRKVREFSRNFIEQWLGTRKLGREFKPDPSIRGYDSELEGGMKYEPVFFFHEILTENRPLLDLIDADYTYANQRLARHYGIRGRFREQPRRVELKPEHRRGGLVSMASVLAVSSYPHRTSPVLRGTWILETLLGDPPPPPPPDVPELEETRDGEPTRSLRERLEQHRSKAACAVCHDRIDPLGFGLENFGVLGRWREAYDGHKVDARGTLPNGRSFDGPKELKQALLERKDQFIRHLTRKMLGYALGRSLTYHDYCVADSIVDKIRANEYRSHELILGIINSVPFRYKAGQVPESLEE